MFTISITNTKWIKKQHPVLLRTDSHPRANPQHHQRQSKSVSLLQEHRSSDPRACDISAYLITTYQFLQMPLKIQYCAKLGRCFFASELESRTVVVEMCASPTCMKRDSYACSSTTKRTLFCLDEVIFWVVVEKRKKGHFWKPRMKGRHAGLNENTILYWVAEEMDVMRRQTVEELTFNRRALKRMDGIDRSVLLDGGEEGEGEYMHVFRYLGTEWKRNEVEGRGALSRETSMASIDAAKAESNRLKLLCVHCANW